MASIPQQSSSPEICSLMRRIPNVSDPSFTNQTEHKRKRNLFSSCPSQGNKLNPSQSHTQQALSQWSPPRSPKKKQLSKMRVSIKPSEICCKSSSKFTCSKCLFVLQSTTNQSLNQTFSSIHPCQCPCQRPGHKISANKSSSSPHQLPQVRRAQASSLWIDRCCSWKDLRMMAGLFTWTQGTGRLLRCSNPRKQLLIRC